METQSKLLNMEYLETRLRDFKAIKQKALFFLIHKSDRPQSPTLYVEFWKYEGEKKVKLKTIRISDHLIGNCPHIQFLVSPNECLTKKKKENFKRCVDNAISQALKRSFVFKLNKVSEENNE